MHAVILAGGKGTRLRPYTMCFPKPLVPLGDLPIIDIVLRQLAAADFNRVTVSVGHLAELMEAYCGSGERWGLRIEYVREEIPLNTAGPLKLVTDCEEHLLVMNGDVLTSLDYREMLAGHVRSGAVATVAAKARTSTIDFGILHVDGDDRLVEYTEKPTYSFLVSMGVYALSKRALNWIGDGEALSMPDLLLRLRDAGQPVRCHRTDAYWLDIGRADDYEQAIEEFAKHRDHFVTA